MKTILILTKNLILEQELQERLQYLSYEVFCSVELFDRLRSWNRQDQTQMSWLEGYLSNYKVIILSETISDGEILTVLPTLKGKGQVLLRKLNSKPSAKEEEDFKELGLDDWISTEDSIDFLREQLSKKMETYHKEETNIVFLYPDTTDTENLKKLRGTLTNRETVALDCLLEANGEVVSREELCARIWNETPNNSHLSQVSVLIKRIKLKLEQAGYSSESLNTIWGRGYLMAKTPLTTEYLLQTR